MSTDDLCSQRPKRPHTNPAPCRRLRPMKGAPTKRVLQRDELARMTLERQQLVRSSDLSDIDLTEHLVGLQAQNPWSWYVGFFRRVAGIRPEMVSAHLAERDLVRMSTMRSTIHLMTPSDAASLRAQTQNVHERTLTSSFGRDLRGINLDGVAADAEELLVARPHTFKELGAALSQRWANTNPRSLAMVARFRLPLVQVVPRGRWGRSGPVAYTTLDTWVGRPVPARASIAQIVLRYLAAFGPATVMDFQAWSGLTKCRTHFDELGDSLRQYESEDGHTLYDLATADHAPQQARVPVRFLYDYDNLLLAYRDRTRFITARYVEMQRRLDGTTLQAVLVHGRTRGMWTHRLERDSSTVTVFPFENLAAADLGEVEHEAINLANWLDPTRPAHVTIDTSWM